MRKRQVIHQGQLYDHQFHEQKHQPTRNTRQPAIKFVQPRDTQSGGQAIASAGKFKIYEGLKNLPPFDDSSETPEAVMDLRNELVQSDGVLICTPEYAFGVPGILKNLLDWTVGSGELVNKPVAVITAATGGDKAHASLLLTLTALSSDTSNETNLLISFVRSKLNANGEVSDPKTATAIESLVRAFVGKLEGMVGL